MFLNYFQKYSQHICVPVILERLPTDKVQQYPIGTDRPAIPKNQHLQTKSMQSVQICNNTQIKVKTSLSLDEPKCTWIIIGHWNATQKLVFGDKVVRFGL